MEKIAKELRKETLYLSYRCHDGNLQSAFSSIDIIWTLYDKVMNWSVDKANNAERDFFIISKGQATLALYPVLIRKGMFERDDVIENIGKFDSRYCIQTDLTKFQGGIENNAGSLGHGFPFAVGIAYANKIKKCPSNVFVLCGDGEFCEGTMWESCIFAAGKKLDNLFVIIDDNDSVKTMIDLGNMSGKLESFGFDIAQVDGHDIDALNKSFSSLIALKNNRPKALIARTVRGYGSHTMMQQDIWFHKSPDSDELGILMREVDEF